MLQQVITRSSVEMKSMAISIRQSVLFYCSIMRVAGLFSSENKILQGSNQLVRVGALRDVWSLCGTVFVRIFHTKTMANRGDSGLSGLVQLPLVSTEVRNKNEKFKHKGKKDTDN